MCAHLVLEQAHRAKNNRAKSKTARVKNKQDQAWPVDKLQSDSGQTMQEPSAEHGAPLSVSSQRFNAGLTTSALIPLTQWVCNYKLNYKPASATLVHSRANAPLPSNANMAVKKRQLGREPQPPCHLRAFIFYDRFRMSTTETIKIQKCATWNGLKSHFCRGQSTVFLCCCWNFSSESLCRWKLTPADCEYCTTCNHHRGFSNR